MKIFFGLLITASAILLAAVTTSCSALVIATFVGFVGGHVAAAGFFER